ncbi:hypothetical protein ACJX0J_011648, partial [Zea mays]
MDEFFSLLEDHGHTLNILLYILWEYITVYFVGHGRILLFIAGYLEFQFSSNKKPRKRTFGHLIASPIKTHIFCQQSIVFT